MVVHQDQGGRVSQECRFEDFARMNDRRRERTTGAMSHSPTILSGLMEFISGTALTHLLARAHAREDLRLDLPDGMGCLVVSFVEGSQAVMVWREGELDLDFVDLLCFHQARIVMTLLPDALTEVWRRRYNDRQTREPEFEATLDAVSRFLEQPYPRPEWLAR